MPKTFLQALTGTVIMSAWFVALCVGLINHDYQGLTLVTPVMLVYAGYLFGESIFRRNGNGNGQ